MKNKKSKQSIIDKFRKLSLHPATIDYLLCLGNELKIYHYHDLIKLNYIEAIQNLSEKNQLKMMENIIENRRRIEINNKSAFMEALLKQDPGEIPSDFWAELIIDKVNELERLYAYTEQAVKGLNRSKKKDLSNLLKSLSIKNLDCLIRIKKSHVN